MLGHVEKPPPYVALINNIETNIDGKYNPDNTIKNIERDEIIIQIFNLFSNMSDIQANNSLKVPLNNPAKAIRTITVPCDTDSSLKIPTDTPIRARPALILRNMNSQDSMKYRSLNNLIYEKSILLCFDFITAYFGFLKKILPTIIIGKYIAAKHRKIY